MNDSHEQFVPELAWEKSCVLLWATIRPDFTKYFTFRFCISLKNFKKKSVNLTFRTISVCKPLQIMNFDGLTFLTAFVLFNQSDYLNHLTRILIGLL